MKEKAIFWVLLFLIKSIISSHYFIVYVVMPRIYTHLLSQVLNQCKLKQYWLDLKKIWCWWWFIRTDITNIALFLSYGVHCGKHAFFSFLNTLWPLLQKEDNLNNQNRVKPVVLGNFKKIVFWKGENLFSLVACHWIIYQPHFRGGPIYRKLTKSKWTPHLVFFLYVFLYCFGTFWIMGFFFFDF